MRAATITFAARAAPQVEPDPPLQGGSPLVVHYDPGRVGPRSRYWGMTDAQVYIRFHPGGHFVCEQLHSRGEHENFMTTREFCLPREARQLEIWLRVIWYVKYGSPVEVWDSDYGKNFWFDVIPPR